MKAGLAALCCVLAWATAWGQSEPAAKKAPAALKVHAEPWRGDFEQMLERRFIRVVVPYSRSLFFNDRGVQRGMTADALAEFEAWLNKRHGKGAHVLTLQVFPVSRDELLPRLVSGHADIAAGNLTITALRDRLVDFSVPIADGIDEIVATGKGVTAPASLDGLGGWTFHARPASSAYESLVQLDERLRRGRQPGLEIVRLPDALEDEDLLEMLNAGLLKAIVIDDWKARLWAPTLKNVKTHPHLAVRQGASIGWAVREDASQLKRVVNEFHGQASRGGTKAARRSLSDYQARYRGLSNPTTQPEWQKFEAAIGSFKKYGARYHFDPLMLAAQAYQESRLDQKAKSRAGALGIMQLMPATGAEMKVGDIAELDANVHAGTKYMRRILDRHFQDADFSEQDRNLFAFASYNAGPTRIAQMRGLAAKQGLDPDRWFNNVEIAAGRHIGQEPVRYVRNIYKYYTAYRLQTDLLAQRTATGKELRRELAPPTVEKTPPKKAPRKKEKSP